jgi:hypothetical protein
MFVPQNSERPGASTPGQFRTDERELVDQQPNPSLN